MLTLIGQPRRFSEIQRTIGGISKQMLARTLRALERDGMVTRTVHATVPPQVEYALTELGRSLADPIWAWVTGPGRTSCRSRATEWHSTPPGEAEGRHRATYSGAPIVVVDRLPRSPGALAHSRLEA